VRATAYRTVAPNFGGFEVCRLSGVWIFEMVSRILKNCCTPDFRAIRREHVQTEEVDGWL